MSLLGKLKRPAIRWLATQLDVEALRNNRNNNVSVHPNVFFKITVRTRNAFQLVPIRTFKAG